MRRTSANRVRIIGGILRGRIVRFPSAEGLRPTPDRVRETLFNWLGQDLEGLRTLDLFAGTGALSLEAASRGAALSVAIDRNPSLVRAIAATAAGFGLEHLETHAADAYEYLSRETRDFDVIFLDPPFGTGGWDRLLPLCAARLGEGGRIYAESPTELVPPPKLARFRHARAGRVHYHLFTPRESGPSVEHD